MSKTFSNIIISTILVGIFCLPISAGFGKKGGDLTFSLNQVEAAGPEFVGGEGEGSSVPPGIDLGCRLLPGLLQTVRDNNTIAKGLEWAGWYRPEPNTNLAGCVAELFFALWQASAWVARGAGHFLDFFVYYSINDASFRNGFIDKGWRVVRDVTNVFFIIALLYVAIKTILSLNTTDNKRLVGTIIIVALLINFSLFTTQVVIDVSNVVAKIFYNGIAPSDSNGVKGSVNVGGDKSISVGMIAKYNPQTILGAGSEEAQARYDADGGTSVFIFVTIILLALTLYTAYIFMSVSILLASRVIALWLSMIFSPLAFASYTVPFEIPGFGHKDWWPELMKNAFLAPIFIFFLYLIVMFLDAGLSIPYENSSTTIQKVMSAVIPFTLLYIMLTQAKKIAVKMSGEIGAGVIGATKLAMGVAGGLALGATAMAGRAVLGQAGAAIANNAGMKAWAARSKIGSAFQLGAEKMSKGSFDLRQVKIKGKGLGSLTGADFGEGKKGGFVQARADRVKKRQERAESLKVGEDEKLTQDLHREETSLQGLLDVSHGGLDDIEKRLKGANDAASAARYAYQNAPNDPAIKEARRQVADAAAQKVNDLRDIKKAINTANGDDEGEAARLIQAVRDRGGASGALATELGHHFDNAQAAATRNNNRSIDHMNDIVIRDAKNAIHHENRGRMNNFADRNNSPLSNIFTTMTGGSWKGNRESSYKIRMDVKLDSKGGSSGH